MQYYLILFSATKLGNLNTFILYIQFKPTSIFLKLRHMSKRHHIKLDWILSREKSLFNNGCKYTEVRKYIHAKCSLK